MQGIPGNENMGIDGAMNGHVGSERREYERIHGGYGFGGGNEAEKRVLDFALSYDLAVINAYFRKSKEHYITYMSGGNRLISLCGRERM